MNYALDRLSDDVFEKVVVSICSQLLGKGVMGFSKGPDGGKDGYFDGTAESYPSKGECWKGKFIIQAKHTVKLEASCSDNDFFKNASSIIKHEVKRLKEQNSKLDCYLLFTNRKQPGGSIEEEIEYIKQELKINNVAIIGLETLDRYLDELPDVVQKYNLFLYELPDRIYEKDIRDVIIAFTNNKKIWVSCDSESSEQNELKYIGKEEKNKLNKISDAYFDDIKSHSLKHFSLINDFLKDPVNYNLREFYENTVSDLRGYLLKNSEKRSFMDLLEEIIKQITGEEHHEGIFQKRKYVRVFVHFMYWNCDIGRIK